MAKFFGKVGFSKLVENNLSVWGEEIIEKEYYGDVIHTTYRYSPADKVHDDFELNNEISIMADDFAYQNAYTMKYVEYIGAKWKISSIRVERPRIILTLGGVYHGPQSSS